MYNFFFWLKNKGYYKDNYLYIIKLYFEKIEREIDKIDNVSIDDIYENYPNLKSRTRANYLNVLRKYEEFKNEIRDF